MQTKIRKHKKYIKEILQDKKENIGRMDAHLYEV